MRKFTREHLQRIWWYNNDDNIKIRLKIGNQSSCDLTFYNLVNYFCQQLISILLRRRKTQVTCHHFNALKITSKYLFVILLICNLFGTLFSKQFIVENPQNTTARLGDTVTLKCQVENQKGTLQWVKNGFGLGTTRDLPLIERYSMVGKLNLGEYHLQIKNVSVEDDDLYECQLSPTDNEPIQISNVAKLSVIAEPEALKFIGLETQPIPQQQFEKQQQSTKRIVVTIEAIEASVIELSCQSANGRPAARLDWAITADPEARNIISYISANINVSTLVHPHHIRAHEQMSEQQHYVGKIIEHIETNDDGFSTITSNLSFSPTRVENGKYLACLASHETFMRTLKSGEVDAAPKSVSVALDVSFRPKIRIEVDKSESSIMEGGRLVLTCFVDARPSRDLNIKWNWSGEDKRLTILDKRRAMISGLKIKDNGAHVMCSATNSIGTETSSIVLDIPYGPRIMSSNQTRLVQRGDSVTFQCEVVGNPQPVIKWFRKDRNDFIAIGANYTISDVQEWEAGEYKCVATVSGFEPKFLIHHLHLKGPPIVNLNRHFAEDENGGATLNCEIQSRLLPVTVAWFYKNNLLANSEVRDPDVTAAANKEGEVFSNRIRLHNVLHEYGVESRLTILQFSKIDYGLYNCTAYNEFGAAHDHLDVFQQTIWQRIVELTKQLSFSYRVALLIGVVCVIVCVLLICCMRCQSDGRSSTKSSFCCCCNGKSKSSNYSRDNCGDVTIKCEALDGEFYPELYGSPQMERSDIVYTKDYISVPQSNPDLDYLPPSAMNFGVISYGQQQQNPYSTHHTFTQGNVGEMNYGITQNAVNLSNLYDNYAPNHYNGRTPDPYSTGISSYDNSGIGMYGTMDYMVGNSSTLGRGIGLTPNGMMIMGSSPLETLTEVVTPDSENDTTGIGDGSGSGDALISSGQLQQRPVSRISTHV